MPDPRALEYLQEEKFEAFNALVNASQVPVDLTFAHLRGFDLRKCNLKTANLEGAYMRSADLRALDLSQANLAGASFKEARISGTLFPRALGADEIMMSIKYGTRLRVDMEP